MYRVPYGEIVLGFASVDRRSEHPVTNPGSDQRKFAREAWIRALERTASIERNPDLTLPLLIGRLADEHEAAPALCGHEASLTFRQLASRCNQYARWGAAQGLKAGDVVCQLMPNGVEYPAVWLGLTRIGVKVALINSHLTGDLLAHSLRIVAPKLVIVDASLAPTLGAVRAALAGSVPCWVHGESSEDMAPLEPRSTQNTTPTSIEMFVGEQFVPQFTGKAAGA